VSEPAAKARVLVVDDDRIILESLLEYLNVEGYAVAVAASFDAAVAELEAASFDVVLTDVNMPAAGGFELLHLCRKRHADTVVIMMTAYGTIESAVEAIKLGAYDYLTKPIIDDELRLCIERALAQQMLLRENRNLRQRLEMRYGLDSLVGQDYRMQKVFDLIEACADSRVPVLIQGESGTGKTLVARVLHQRSPRRERPFVEVSCGAIPETLLESELFGHVRGAFTGAVAAKIGRFKTADGGTIFLDEIATAPASLQVKLLRVLQSQQFEPVGSSRTQGVDVRLLTASNVDLEEEVRAGRFREDLYYRINVVMLHMPALRERVADIPLLAQRFLDHFTAESSKHITAFAEDALEVLQRYDWPGNVRELENAVHRAVVFCRGPRVSARDLPPRILRPSAAGGFGSESGPAACGGGSPAGDWRPMPLRQALEEPERTIIERALRHNGWNRQLTAEQLGINRTTLYKKMKHYGLLPEPQPAH
jgi:DNA-binding NtrC family response regulator